TMVMKKDRFNHPLLRKSLGGVDEGLQLAMGAMKNALQVATRRLPRYPDIAEVIGRFYRSLQDGTPPPVSAEQGREVVRLIHEVVQSMISRNPRWRILSKGTTHV